MNRGYTVEDFKYAIQTIKRKFPNIKIRTQCIVGFPTETDEEFNDTINFLDEMNFSFVEVYKFQPRPMTKTAKLKGHISLKVANKRYFKLLLKVFSKNIIRKRGKNFS